LDGKAGGKNHFEVDCLASTEFSKTERCKRITCDDIPEVDNGKTKVKKAKYNETVKYTCEKGYTIDGTAEGDAHFKVSCLVNGMLGQVSKCMPVTCGEPDEVANAHRPSGSMVFEDEVEYECHEGFTLDGKRDSETKFAVKCLKSGKFSKAKSCLPKICGAPSKKINALHATTANEGKIAYPRVTEVTCNDGYTVDGKANGKSSFIVKCESDGQFSEYDKDECEPVKCGAPPKLQNAVQEGIVPAGGDGLLTFLQSADGGARFGDMVEYQCQPGYTVGGEPSAPTTLYVDCLSTGEFSIPPVDMQCRNVNDCELYTCGENGTCVDEVGEAPAYTCKCQSGYDLRTKDDGTKFCGNTDDCKGMDCGPGVCKDLIGDYTCECPSGHYIGEKDGKKTCVPVRCAEEAPELENGKQTSNHKKEIDFPMTLEYRCSKGYSTDGTLAESKRNFNVQCKPDGQLVGMASCQKINCGTAPVLPFTKLKKPKSPQDQIKFGDKAEYECEEGYTKTGKAGGDNKFSIECEVSGKLGKPEICEPVQCGDAPEVKHATPALAGDVSYGMGLEYTCNTGYSMDGTLEGDTRFELKCQKDGKFNTLEDDEIEDEEEPWEFMWTEDEDEDTDWQDGELWLLAEKAGKKPPPGHGKGHWKKVRKHRLGANASHAGRKLSLLGKLNQTAKRAGKCRPISAGQAPEIKNAYLVEVDGEYVEMEIMPKLVYPQGVEYECMPEFTENGAPDGPYVISARVNSQGQLEPPLPSECKHIVYTVRGQVSNARSGKALSGVRVSVEGSDISATSEEGFFTLSGVTPGNITVAYKMSQFENIKKTFMVTGDVNTGGVADVALSPKLKENQYRAILKWGAKPLDLDAYAKWSSQKVFSGNTYARGANMKARLVTDATNGYGPEVLFMKDVGTCKKEARNQCDMRYEVNDPKGKGLLDSGAEVMLYSKNGLEGTFKISDCKDTVSKDAKWWHVFTLNGKNGKVKWSCTSGQEPPPSFPVPEPKKGKGGKGGKNNNTDDEIEEEEGGGLLDSLNPFSLHAKKPNATALGQISVHGKQLDTTMKSALQIPSDVQSEPLKPLHHEIANDKTQSQAQGSWLSNLFSWMHAKAFGATPAAPTSKPTAFIQTAQKAFRSGHAAHNTA